MSISGGRRDHAELHQVQQGGAAGQVLAAARARRTRRFRWRWPKPTIAACGPSARMNWNGRISLLPSSNAAACLMAATMLG